MSFAHLPIGDKSPETINVVVEVPRGTRNKYEYDEKLDEIRLDRVLHSAVFYPVDYGFIPETRAEDGDHLDVLILISEPTFPGCILEVRPVGILDMADENGQDWKILAVASKDPIHANVNTVTDVNEHLKKEIAQFFETYKNLENGKWAKLQGWLDIDEAHRRIEEARERFTEAG